MPKKQAVSKKPPTLPGILLSERQLTKLVNTVVKRFTGREIEPGTGLGRFQAMCNDHVLKTWFGPCEPTPAKARADARAHNTANPRHHAVVIGPMICEENE